MGGANEVVGEGRDAAARSVARRRNRVECVDDDDDDDDDGDDDVVVGADRIDDDHMDACVFYSSYMDVARRVLSSPERDTDRWREVKITVDGGGGRGGGGALKKQSDGDGWMMLLRVRRLMLSFEDTNSVM